MNPTEHRIFNIIRSDVCGNCTAYGISRCDDHRTRNWQEDLEK